MVEVLQLKEQIKVPRPAAAHLCSCSLPVADWGRKSQGQES